MNKTNRYIILHLILVLTLLSGCQKRLSNLEYALQISGKNKGELEKVLNHYAHAPQDSLKLEAAIFLIENMPGHYALNGPFLEGFKQILDTTTDLYLLKKVMMMQPSRTFPYDRQLKVEPDVEYIKGDYLIHNIDLAFHLWETRPWLEGLSFEDFCEYLLPYRIDKETIDYWKDSTDSYYEKRIQEAIQYFDDQKYSTHNIGQQILNNPFRANVSDRNIAGISCSTAECSFVSRSQLIALRAAGIPSAMDHVPYWADMNGFHQWTVIIDSKNNDISSGQLETKNAPKIYRRTYARNEIPIPEGDEYIPPFFTDPFNRDVTEKYQQTSDVEVKCQDAITAKINHAYLTIFNRQVLRIVSWCKVKNDKVIFKNMGRNIVYFPVYIEGNETKNFSYPLILQGNEKTHTLKPDKEHPCNLRVTRKYPLHSNKVYHGKLLLGAQFKCANDASFQSAVTVHEISQNPNMLPISVKTDTTRKYRYWLFDHNNIVELAEWSFKDSRGAPIRGKIIDPSGNGNNLDNIVDGYALSYGRIYHQLLVDFGKPVSISEMTYLPRNDANGIYPGNEYELFYFDLDGWHSLGCKIATSYSVEFDQVPSNAIYWLRNHTTGSEERIFTWENEKQRFW